MSRRRRGAAAPVPPTAPRPRRPAPEARRHRLPSFRSFLVGLTVVGVVGFIGLTFAGSLTARDYSCGEILSAPPGASGSDGFTTESLGGEHVAAGTTIPYGFCPPTSGSHYNAAGAGPLRPGFYGSDAAAGPGGWVHNLEHGFVVALYRCANGACPSATDLAALRTFAADGPPTPSAAACGYSSKVIAVRFDEMATPYALVAWDTMLQLDRFDASVAGEFARRSIDATAPEPNAC